MSTVVEGLLDVERNLFLSLNSSHSPYWDIFMWMYTGKHTWIPLVLVFLFIAIYKTKWQESLFILVGAVLVGVLCDQISASFVKPFFLRLRPTHHPDFNYLVDTVFNYRGGRYGFVSSHATNGFGIATFASLLFRYKYFTYTFILWALGTCYTRIYLGVHFISDVVGGTILGIAIGYFVYSLYTVGRRYILQIPAEELCIPVLGESKARTMIFTVLIIVASMAIYAGIFETQFLEQLS